MIVFGDESGISHRPTSALRGCSSVVQSHFNRNRVWMIPGMHLFDLTIRLMSDYVDSTEGQTIIGSSPSCTPELSPVEFLCAWQKCSMSSG